MMRCNYAIEATHFLQKPRYSSGWMQTATCRTLRLVNSPPSAAHGVDEQRLFAADQQIHERRLPGVA